MQKIWRAETPRCLRPALIAALLLGLGACASAAPEQPAATEPALAEPEVNRIIDLAEEALEEERYDDANVLLQRVRLAAPDDARAVLYQGELLLAQGHVKRALALFEELTDRPAVAARAAQGEGLALLLAGQHDKARASLERAVAGEASLWRAWNGLGYLDDMAGDWVSAEASYGRALGVKRDSAILYNNRGFSRLMQARPDAAIADFEQALRLKPDLAAAETNLRLAHAWSGRYATAVSGTAERDRGGALNNAGFIALVRGDFDNAEAYLLQAMEAEASFNKAAWQNLTYLRQVQQAGQAAAAAGGAQ